MKYTMVGGGAVSIYVTDFEGVSLERTACSFRFGRTVVL